MKGLKVADIRRKLLDLHLSQDTLVTGKQLFCFNSFLESFFYANSSGIFQVAEESKVILEWPGRFQDDTVVSLEFISDDFRLCAIFDCGAALLVDLDSQEAETVNLNVSNILGASWAPDFHSLVVNTRNSIAFFTREFQLIHLDEIFPTKPGKEELVTLGWGSEQTQFQGSAGRKKLSEKRIEKETVVLEYDEKNAVYCWSGDAKFFALSCVNLDTSVRRFYVWNDEGELISRLSTLQCVESPVAFKPSGGLIAVSRVLDGNHEVVLFERNGQKRSEFTLFNNSDSHVSWLGWNSDGTVLAVIVNGLTDASEEVQFWCRSNYKWQLKYCLRLTEALFYASWDCEKPLAFNYLTTSGDMVTVNFEFAYDIYDMNIIFLDVPKTVCFTDLFVAPVPPPMAHYSHEFPCAVSNVAIALFGAIFLLSNNKVALFGKDGRKFIFEREYSLNDDIVLPSSICYNLQYHERDRFTMIVCYKGNFVNYRVVEVNLGEKPTSCTLYQSVVPLLWHHCIDDGILVQTSMNDWLIVKKSSDGGTLVDRCPWISIKVQDNERLSRRCFLPKVKSLLGLTRDNVLLFNGAEFCTNVGSYSVDEEYLIFLLLPSIEPTSRLIIVNVKDIKNMQLPYIPVGGRVVERGAVIVGHELDGTRVWLQMPRGNLETIHLRYLVLKKVDKCFSAHNYREAVVLMRKHRIDMNLIFDRDPQMFLQSVPQFVENVADPDLLNLFILNLSADDTTKTMYAQYYTNGPKKEAVYVNKINVVCAAIQSYLLGLPLEKLTNFFTCLLSTYVKMEPRNLSDALNVIHSYSKKVENGEDMMRKWLEYLTILVPNENLFKAALGVYDLDLATVVARNSQLDPREYSSILSEFKSVDSLAYQRFRIDVWLERYERAVENIAEVPERFDEAKSFIQQRQLYSKALEVFCGRPGYNDICILFAKQLFDRHLYNEAEMLYISAGQLDQAVHCAELIGDWKSFVSLSGTLNLTDSERNEKLLQMANVLEKKEKYIECAQLLVYMGREPDRLRILKLFSLGNDWTSLSRFACSYSEIKEEGAKYLLNQKALCSTTISKLKNEWTEYWSRLEAIRKDKKARLQTIIDSGNTEFDETASELSSETSSVVSSVSKASTRTAATSQTSRRRERKKANLKVGSQYEDAALLHSMKIIAERVQILQEEMHSLLLGLISLNCGKEASQLQKALLELTGVVRTSIPKIWPTVIEPYMLLGPLSEIFRCDDGVIRYSAEGGMPGRVILDQELYPPAIKPDAFWTLNILKS